jgi:putative aldouronate transport system substrate-binding protein
VRDNDVNRNGNPNDEIPFAGELNNTVSFFAKSFMPWISGGLALYDGKVTEQYRQNEFREALKYINGLYKEGLILKDSFSITSDQFLALGESPTPVLAAASSSWPGFVSAPGVRFSETRVLQPLTGPTGQAWAPNGDPWSILFARAVITDKCKNPAAAIALYDYLMDFDVAMEAHQGQKGVTWDEATPGSLGINGQPARYKLLTAFGTGTKTSIWGGYAPVFGNPAVRVGLEAPTVAQAIRWIETGDPSMRDVITADKDYVEIFYYQTSMMLSKWKIPQEYFIPPLAMNDADNIRLSDINAVLNSYKQQAFAEFITGTRDINSNADWNAYLADLDRIGSKDLVAIYQKYIK